MKKWLKALPLTALLLASPIKTMAENMVVVLPLVWSRNFVQAVNYVKIEGKKENKYSFFYRSVAPVPEFADRFLDNFYETDWNITWSGGIKWRTNYGQWARIVESVDNDYKGAQRSYEELQKNIGLFVENMDDLEGRINDPAIAQDIGNVKGFALNWENSLSADVDYSEKSVGEVAKIINIASEMVEIKSSFDNLSAFITETENNIEQYDNETRNSIYAASDSKQLVSDNMYSLSSLTSRISSAITDSGLDNPLSEMDYEIGFALFFKFGPGPK